MIHRLSHATIYCHNQDEARKFYTDALGFEVKDDATAAKLAELLTAGALGTGVFETDDCHKTFEELSGRGVEFVQEPAERPYGMEAIFKDVSGNWFSLTERRG